MPPLFVTANIFYIYYIKGASKIHIKNKPLLRLINIHFINEDLSNAFKQNR